MVLRVLAHREDGRLRMPDVLAVEEVGVEPGDVVDACLRELLGDRGARSRFSSISRTPIPWPSSSRAMAVPTLPAPKITTSLTSASHGASTSPHAIAAFGEPITTSRSPARMMPSPRGNVIDSSRMIAATRESAGITAVAQRPAEDRPRSHPR